MPCGQVGQIRRCSPHNLHLWFGSRNWPPLLLAQGEKANCKSQILEVLWMLKVFFCSFLLTFFLLGFKPMPSSIEESSKMQMQLVLKKVFQKGKFWCSRHQFWCSTQFKFINYLLVFLLRYHSGCLSYTHLRCFSPDDIDQILIDEKYEPQPSNLKIRESTKKNMFN